MVCTNERCVANGDEYFATFYPLDFPEYEYTVWYYAKKSCKNYIMLRLRKGAVVCNFGSDDGEEGLDYEIGKLH